MQILVDSDIEIETFVTALRSLTVMRQVDGSDGFACSR